MKSLFLRRALLADALISGATGVLLLALAPFLAGLFGLPEGLLRWAGLTLVPFVALVGALARRDEAPRGAVWVVIASNVLWVAASALVLVSGRFAPSGLGTAFVVAQALAVAAFAEMQFVGLRRATA